MTESADPISAVDSPAITAARERLELERLRLERRRLGLDDMVTRAEARSKAARGSVEAVRAYLPSSLDTPVEKDTLTTQGDATGIAAVYAGRAVFASIDDIADQVVTAINHLDRPEILVVAEASFVSDQQRADQIGLSLGLLEDALTDAVLPVVDGELDSSTLQQARAEASVGTASLLGPVLGAVGSLVPSAVATLTRLFSHQYVVSGASIETPELGVDLRLAGVLRAKMASDPSVEILVGRLWDPTESPLLERLLVVADRLLKLKKQVVAANVARDRAAASVQRTREGIVSGREVRKTLSASAPTTAATAGTCGDSAWQTAWNEVSTELTTLTDRLATLEDDLASKEDAADRLADLVTQVEDFVSDLLATPDSGVAPLVDAMRGEWRRGSDQRLVVYARALAAGVDQVLDVKVGPDRRSVLSGVTIEYAAIGQGGRLLLSGVYDGLWTASMKLADPSTFRGEPVGYAPVANVRRPPAPDGP